MSDDAAARRARYDAAQAKVRERRERGTKRVETSATTVLAALVDSLRDDGVDPYPIIAETLREMGWTVEEPT